MGLKINNYEVKSMNVTLPTAYAVIRDITVKGEMGVATFAIHESRELAINSTIRPYHTENVHFKVERNVNDRVTAYAKATTPYVEKQYNDETGKLEEVTKYPFFYGWGNDIVLD